MGLIVLKSTHRPLDRGKYKFWPKEISKNSIPDRKDNQSCIVGQRPIAPWCLPFQAHNRTLFTLTSHKTCNRHPRVEAPRTIAALSVALVGRHIMQMRREVCLVPIRVGTPGRSIAQRHHAEPEDRSGFTTSITFSLSDLQPPASPLCAAATLHFRHRSIFLQPLTEKVHGHLRERARGQRQSHSATAGRFITMQIKNKLFIIIHKAILYAIRTKARARGMFLLLTHIDVAVRYKFKLFAWHSWPSRVRYPMPGRRIPGTCVAFGIRCWVEWRISIATPTRRACYFFPSLIWCVAYLNYSTAAESTPAQPLQHPLARHSAYNQVHNPAHTCICLWNADPSSNNTKSESVTKALINNLKNYSKI